MKALPKFKNAIEEALFWENHNILDYVDKSEFKVIKPSPAKVPHNVLISLRVDENLLKDARTVSRQNHLPYQSILKQWLWAGRKHALAGVS